MMKSLEKIIDDNFVIIWALLVFLWVVVIGATAIAQTITLPEQRVTIPETRTRARTIVVPEQQIELPEHTHPLPDHLHPFPEHTHPELAVAPATTPDSQLPTAEQLSQPGACQAFIEKCLKETGHCQLPPGVIKTDPISMRYVHGGTIEGAGPAAMPVVVKNGWRNSASVRQANTTLQANDPSKPLLRFLPGMNLEVCKLALDTPGVGIEMPQLRGWGPGGWKLSRVAFHGCSIGFQAGNHIKDFNAADVTIDGCWFVRCKVGVQVAHQQGVNYTFTGQNWFGYCERAVVFNGGGFSNLENLCGYGVGTWLTFKAGGPNLMPCRITHLYSDRSNTDRPPIIVDASDAAGLVRVIVDGVKVTKHLGDDKNWPDHVYYRSPKHGEIRVRDNDLNTYPAGGIYEPQGAAEKPQITAEKPQ